MSCSELSKCICGEYKYCSRLCVADHELSQLRTALAAEQKHSAQLQKRIETLNSENLSINAALVQAQERATRAENKIADAKIYASLDYL